jgi:hypothetical protein
VLAYDSIVGSDNENEEDSTTDTGTEPGYVPPTESTVPAPAAPAPTEPAPTEPAPAAPEDTAPAPATPPPTDGGPTDGGTGATGAAG